MQLNINYSEKEKAGTVNIPLRARYIRTNGRLSAGLANDVATFIIEYYSSLFYLSSQPKNLTPIESIGVSYFSFNYTGSSI